MFFFPALARRALAEAGPGLTGVGVFSAAAEDFLISTGVVPGFLPALDRAVTNRSLVLPTVVDVLGDPEMRKMLLSYKSV